MAVVLDNDTGERVFLYAWDGSARQKILATTAGLLRQTPDWTQVLTYAYEDAPLPHASTVRWIYTVPAGRIAQLDALCLRLDASTSNGSCAVYVQLARGGGTAYTVVNMFSLSAIPQANTLTVALALVAGDVLTGHSSNADLVARAIGIGAFFREITL